MFKLSCVKAFVGFSLIIVVAVVVAVVAAVDSFLPFSALQQTHCARM